MRIAILLSLLGFVLGWVWFALRTEGDGYSGRTYEVVAEADAECRAFSIAVDGLRFRSASWDDVPVEWRDSDVAGTLTLEGWGSDGRIGGYFQPRGGKAVTVVGDLDEEFFSEGCTGWSSAAGG
jgi:hypothetical protein